MIYLYEGDFDAFLTCIYHHYYDEKAEAIYEEKHYQPKLLTEVRFVEKDQEKADTVHEAIMTQFSEHMYFSVYHTFLSNEVEKDTWLLKYIELAFRYKKRTADLRAIDEIYRVEKLGRQVGFEKHRFLGLLRFSDIGNCLYAKFEPDHNIVTLLADHFADRFGKERFIIHDVRRNLAVIGYDKQWILTDFDRDIEEERLKEEVFFRALWKEYFDHIGIEGRKNLSIQQSFVPLKYRKHLVEFAKQTSLVNKHSVY